VKHVTDNIQFLVFWKKHSLLLRVIKASWRDSKE